MSEKVRLDKANDGRATRIVVKSGEKGTRNEEKGRNGLLLPACNEVGRRGFYT